ncbi:MAG TPA: glycerate kinase [Verrucomicrobiae bacterium]|nr:glycerate kinase [Verrucomicrobiae bacterium]
MSKIVVAPDSFKGSLNALGVARALERGIHRVDGGIDTRLVPMADGGEGTVEALVAAAGGKIVPATVTGPLGKPVDSFFGVLGDGETAVIEMAAASGLPLVPPAERNPLYTTTFGTGELIKLALEMGMRKLIIGVGGSATNDGGTGMAAALGIRFLDQAGNELPPGGGYLDGLHSLDMSGLDARIKEADIKVACDVTNPLCGPTGASRIYGPQKGACPDKVETLDKNLAHFSDVVHRELGKDLKDMPGAGAAGGLGFGLVAFLNAKLLPGVQIVLEAANIDELVRGADLVITGEGQTDQQTLFGKAPVGVAEVADKYGVPVVCISGGLGQDYELLYKKGFTSLFSIVEGPMSLDQAMKDAGPLLERAAERVLRLFLVGKK